MFHQHGILEGFHQLETQRVLDERLEHVGLMVERGVEVGDGHNGAGSAPPTENED